MQTQFSSFHREEVVKGEIPSGESQKGEKLRLGAFEKISGTNYLVAPLSSAQTQPLRLSERQSIAIHNYLFVNVQDQ